MAHAPTFRLLAVADTDLVGEDAQQLAALLQRLPSRWRATAVVPGRGALEDCLLQAAVAVRRLPMPRWRLLAAPLAIATVLRIRRVLRLEKPHCIYANGARAAMYWALAARSTGIPVVWHCRDMTAHRWIDAVLTRYCRRIVVDSHATAHRFAGKAKPGVEVVYNGVDLGWLQQAPELPRPALLQAQWRTLLCIAPLIPGKGHKLLLDAFDALAARQPNLHLAIVGDEDPTAKDYARGVYDHARDLALDSLVHWVRAGMDLRPWLHHCELLVMPAEHEAAGRGLIEAMATGLPVVAVSGGAAPELINSAENALVVPPADPVALAESIERILTDQDLRAQFKVNGRVRARQFSIDAHVRKMTAMFDGIVGFGER